MLAEFTSPPPTIALRASPEDKQKTIVIGGCPRGGTTYAASLVASLGFRFGDAESTVGLLYSNPEIMRGFHDDRSRFIAESRRLDQSLDVWAFKLGDIVRDFDFAMKTLRNPHFIFVLKEPMSVAMRSAHQKEDRVDVEIIPAMTRNVLRLYTSIVEFSMKSAAPALLISFEKALADPHATIHQVAAFLGAPEIDVSALKKKI